MAKQINYRSIISNTMVWVLVISLILAGISFLVVSVNAAIALLMLNFWVGLGAMSILIAIISIIIINLVPEKE